MGFVFDFFSMHSDRLTRSQPQMGQQAPDVTVCYRQIPKRQAQYLLQA